ncbi:hypothetical protein PtA15_8A784 [Puccinia triticina]|uniref:Uncharacterized protein n=1 Tax=Puccinia triticina TaxID=208348 RepID=A0ABY7CRI1_9BASI|nr:uncharacterized protein PtA15_8A784 [Puccinia triticina]WAQ87876.1 hypothetical protein PtA15_8A784 [Puccinia triticina]
MEQISFDQKVLNICQELRAPPTVLTPKQFIQRFLTSSNSDIAYLLIPVLVPQAINITATQIPPTGNYPAGRFHSSTTVKQGFLTAETQAIHDGVLTELDMPFVFDLMMGMLNAQPPENADQQEESGVPASAEVITNDLASPDVLSGISYTQVAHAQDRF